MGGCMSLMLRRRAMMACKAPNPYDEFGYINKGKIFHLDGIAKGETADAWTEIVNGYIFSKFGSVSELTNGWEFPGNNSSYFEHLGNIMPNNNDATVEICFIPQNESAAVLSSSNHYRNRIQLYKNNAVYTFLDGLNTITFATTFGNKYTFSMNLNGGLFNGTQVNINSGSDYWSTRDSENRIRIGCRYNVQSNTNAFKGTIYAIRAYNRRISFAEMLNNQQVDNLRFNLGLTI